MNASLLARSAYAPTHSGAGAPIRPARAVEYDAFARVTRGLSEAAPDSPAGVAALHQNRRLWTTLAGDVADAGNGLPAPLRARIFYLAEFTFQHTSRILAGRGEPGVLAEINAAVMAGLQQAGAMPPGGTA